MTLYYNITFNNGQRNFCCEGIELFVFQLEPASAGKRTSHVTNIEQEIKALRGLGQRQNVLDLYSGSSRF
jgi:hypothetical protein